MSPRNDDSGMRSRRLQSFCRNGIYSFLIMIACISSVWGGEGGSSSYLVGFSDLMAGVLPSPGFYLRNDSIWFQGKENELLAEGFLQTKVSISNYINITRFTYVTPLQILNSYWGMSMRVPIVNSDFTGEINSPIFISRANQSINNFGDMVLSPLILGWHRDYFHVVISVPSVYVPTGTYSLSRYVNAGKNRYAIQADINSTYYNTSNGLEATAAIGYTKNFMNYATDYLSGSELHADVVMAEHMQSDFTLGAAGFFLQQVTSDSGAGATLGSNKGMAIGLGPVAEYNTRFMGLNINLRAKYYYNINAINRLSGDWVWVSLLLS